MIKKLCSLAFVLAMGLSNFAQTSEDTLKMVIDSIEKSLVYQTGSIALAAGNATIHVPTGFRFLDQTQANYVLTELWGNPMDQTVVGMLVPQDRGVLDSATWVFAVSYDGMGYVEDGEAEDIDYNELLEQLKKDAVESNAERRRLGYPTAELLGWAAEPHYDAEKKVLHWAKELQFEGETAPTLNYDLRVLGRKGVIVMGAIAGMGELPVVQQNIESILSSVKFDEGFQYDDFDSSVDEVAAVGIGGLIAGKVLAKVGFFAIIAKFGKIIILGIVAAGAGIWRFITGRKKAQEESITPTQIENNDQPSV